MQEIQESQVDIQPDQDGDTVKAAEITENNTAVQQPPAPDAETEGSQKNDIDTFYEVNQAKIKEVLSSLMSGINKFDNLIPEFEPQIKALEDKAQELEEKERELNLMKLQMETVKLLEAEQIPASVMELVLDKDLASTSKKIALYKSELDKGVMVEVNNRLRGNAPKYAASNNNASDKNVIRDIINGR